MRRELVETASWLPVWLAVMEDNAAMISVFPTVKLRCACEVYAGCTLSLPSLYLCRREPRSSARGLIIPLMSHGFTKALQIRLSARECVVFPRMVRPSPISGDNKRQPWSLREISKIREKRRELGWLRVTSLAENFVRNFGSLVSLRLNEWQAICGKQMSQTATAEKAFPHRGRSYIQQTGRVNPP